jgi:hypothetical protein
VIVEADYADFGSGLTHELVHVNTGWHSETLAQALN